MLNEDTVDRELERLVEKRASADKAQRQAIDWKLSDQRRAQLEHAQNKVLWQQHHAKMAEQFAMLSAEHARRARRLEGAE